MNDYCKEIIYKFLKKYMFVYKAAADGWRIKYHNRNKISFYNNINNIPQSLTNQNVFKSYYNINLPTFG